MTRRNRYKESRKQLKDRLIREGRWEEFMKVRENLKAAGVPQGEAWVQASLQFEPGAAGAVPPMPRDNPREIPASPPSPPAIPAASPGPANEAAVAISQAHIAAGHPSPVQNPQVRELLNGIKRSKGTAPAKKTALLMKDIRTMVSQLPGNLLGIRDRALLLLGFAGAFRRSELTALDVEDLKFNEDGMIVRVRCKTDAEGRGEKVGIPYGSNPATCPVRALRAWLEASEIQSGALFRGINRHGQILAERLTSQSIAKVVKRYAEAAGLNPELYGAHSLRPGFATQADLAGAKFTDIKRQGRWKNDATVREYMQRSELFESNAAAELGL